MERGSPGHHLLALKILNMLATEVNTATPVRTLTAASDKVSGSRVVIFQGSI
jgi:hypothetical protein